MAFAWTVDSGGTLTNQLVGAYNLENTNDDSATAATLTNNGTTPFNPAKNNNGADQGTTNTTKWLDTTNSLGIAGGSVSISLWVKVNTAPTAGAQQQLGFQCNVSSSNVDNRITYWDSSGTPKLRYLRNKIGTAVDTLDVAVTLSTSAFTHLIYTYDGTNIEGWVNGLSQGTKLASGTGGGGSESTGFSIGAEVANFNSEIASSILDAVYVWKRKLTNTEVADLYNSGTGSFYISSGGGGAVAPLASMLLMGV